MSGKFNYTCGFLFRDNKVLLVEKNRPRWQEGLLNGIGGKVDPFETFDDGMRREFFEETGLDVGKVFSMFAIEHGIDYACFFYKAQWPPDSLWQTPPWNDIGESLMWVDVGHIHDSRAVVGDLKWLIPLALDPRRLSRVSVYSPLDNISEKPTW
jgi:8-oxo-dGTP diphosphatase